MVIFHTHLPFGRDLASSIQHSWGEMWNHCYLKARQRESSAQTLDCEHTRAHAHTHPPLLIRRDSGSGCWPVPKQVHSIPAAFNLGDLGFLSLGCIPELSSCFQTLQSQLVSAGTVISRGSTPSPRPGCASTHPPIQSQDKRKEGKTCPSAVTRATPVPRRRAPLPHPALQLPPAMLAAAMAPLTNAMTSVL